MCKSSAKLYSRNMLTSFGKSWNIISSCWYFGDRFQDEWNVLDGLKDISLLLAKLPNKNVSTVWNLEFFFCNRTIYYEAFVKKRIKREIRSNSFTYFMTINHSNCNIVECRVFHERIYLKLIRFERRLEWSCCWYENT